MTVKAAFFVSLFISVVKIETTYIDVFGTLDVQCSGAQMVATEKV